MDANLQAQIIAEIRKSSQANKALVLQALGGTTLPGPVVQPTPTPSPGFDLSQIGAFIQSPLIQQLFSGKSATEILQLIPVIMALLQGHPLPSPPAPPPPPPPPPPAPVVPPPGSNNAANWSLGIGAALTALGLSGAGIIGSPVPGDPAFSMTGLLSFFGPLVTAGFAPWLGPVVKALPGIWSGLSSLVKSKA